MSDALSLAARPGVLVVDDEPLVRSLLDVVLGRAGFAVWTANGGRAAVDIYRQNQSAISVVLLDVRMPDMDGPATLAALRRINPAVACCFLSGCTGEYAPETLLALGAVRLFDKPFDPDELTQALRQIVQLAGRRTG